MDKQTETFYDYDGREIPQRYMDLWEAHNTHPVDERVWSKTIEIAKQEEGTPVGRKGFYGRVPLQDLLTLAEKVRGEKDGKKRYELISEKGPTGDRWFDTLIGLSTENTISALIEEIDRGYYRYKRGLDIGTGTGNLAEAIKERCWKFVMADQADFLLKIARERGWERTWSNKDASYVAANALQLPFKDGSFDLAVSHGLTSSFTRDELKAFAKEMNRILEDHHGSYYDSFGMLPEDDLQIWEQKSLINAKGILADLIVDAVSGSGRMREKDQVSGNEFIRIFQEAGLTPSFSEHPLHQTSVVKFSKLFYKTPHGLSQQPS